MTGHFLWVQNGQVLIQAAGKNLMRLTNFGYVPWAFDILKWLSERQTRHGMTGHFFGCKMS
jgi:hypothetical protein